MNDFALMTMLDHLGYYTQNEDLMDLFCDLGTTLMARKALEEVQS